VELLAVGLARDVVGWVSPKKCRGSAAVAALGGKDLPSYRLQKRMKLEWPFPPFMQSYAT